MAWPWNCPRSIHDSSLVLEQVTKDFSSKDLVETIPVRNTQRAPFACPLIQIRILFFCKKPVFSWNSSRQEEHLSDFSSCLLFSISLFALCISQSLHYLFPSAIVAFFIQLPYYNYPEELIQEEIEREPLMGAEVLSKNWRQISMDVVPCDPLNYARSSNLGWSSSANSPPLLFPLHHPFVVMEWKTEIFLPSPHYSGEEKDQEYVEEQRRGWQLQEHTQEVIITI